jgi:ferrochelatase
MTGASRNAVLLLAHGSPDRPEDVPEFLRSITRGRPIPQPVIEEVTHRYRRIGHSPLTEITLRQAELVASILALPVYVGMRNWHPLICDTLSRMAAEGVAQAVVICLAPQNSRTSVGLYRQAVMGEAGPPFAIDFVESWHDHPLLVRAFAEKLRAGWEQACAQSGARLPVIFTAHSVPERTIEEGDPYERQARETAALVAAASGVLRPQDWTFAFQSQGMSGGEWLGPTVEDAILELRAKQHSGVFVDPIGFLCDHVEVLYDIDIGFRQFAGEHGMNLWRAESLNDSLLLASAIADLARSRLQLPARAVLST